MQIVLILLAALAVLELALYGPLLRWQRFGAVFLAAAGVVSYIRLLLAMPTLAGAIVVFIGLYKLINLWRVRQQRLQPDYLLSAARRSSLWLMFFQAFALAAAWLLKVANFNSSTSLYLLSSVQLVIAAWLLILTLQHIRKITPPHQIAALAEKDYPSLSVAIPARNESEELEGCLTSLVASSYPKLEIIVLDDCSQSKRTPEIIRSFASSGVRFIAGKEPSGNWLAKNYAYKQLAEVANGELILFCGTDVRFDVNSLNRVVELLLAKHKQMLCILPRNSLPQKTKLKALLIQPARYAWELVPPRRWLGRPPVLSTCWLIRAEALARFGGFDAVQRKIIPESYFARQASANNDGYSFLQSNTLLGISSAKNFTEQRSTAIRTRYPQLHRRLELVPLMSLVEFLIQLWPFIAFLMGLLTHHWLLAVIAFAEIALNSVVFSKVASLTYRQFVFSSSWVWPLAAFYDIALLNYSMWKYEFGEVLWKGRNVCLPVMRIAVPATADSAQKP